MSALFLKILNMSISASWLAAAVIIFRFVFKKAPKWMNVLLWGIVAIRLVCPFTIESDMSLMPKSVDEGILQTYMEDVQIYYDNRPDAQISINQGIHPINGGEDGTYVVNIGDELPMENTWLPGVTVIWCIGMAAMAVYTLSTYLRLCRNVTTAVRLRDNIYQSEMVASPFVLGIFKPIIYLPFQLNEKETSHVIAHEQAHLKRMDHLWKPLGFVILTIHWFNPILWIAYALFCRDLEMACDEKVIKELEYEERAAYSESLLACSMERKQFAACPLAFGEVSVKERVRSILKYKKPAFWMVVLAVAACIVMAVCFLTTPPETVNDADSNSVQLVPGTTYVSDKCIYMNPLSSYYPVGGDSGEKYIVGINSWDTVNRSTGAMNSVQVEKWEWQKFPYTEEEWQDLIKYSLNDNISQISDNTDDILYKPLSDMSCLLLIDSELWLVHLKNNGRMGTYIWDVYSLVPEESKGSVKWTFDPLSSARLPYFRFSFNLDYEEVSAVCVQSPLVDMESNERDYEMIIPKGKDLYWSPMEDDGRIVSQAEIAFFINVEGDTHSHAGKIYINSEEAENGKQIYTATIIGRGLHLSQDAEQDGGIINGILTNSTADIDNGINDMQSKGPIKFMAYVQGLDGNKLTVDQVEWVDIPSERSQELNITEDEYPSGFAVYNEGVAIEELPVSENFVCKILNWTNNYVQEEVTLEELSDILKERAGKNIPYHLTVKNQEIIEIEEQYIP